MKNTGTLISLTMTVPMPDAERECVPDKGGQTDCMANRNGYRHRGMRNGVGRS